MADNTRNVPRVNSVRVLCGTHAYACIELYGGAAMDVRLAPGRGVAAALREYAEGQAEIAERALRKGQIAEAAARYYEENSK